MITLSQIQQPIEEHLKEFDTFIAEQFHTENDLLSNMLRDALSSRGKGVRPMLVMLAAAMVSKSGYISKRAYIAAMMCEMIHLASLVHDDVIDEAPTRRGKPSLNAKWQSKRAVLVGDYILARNLNIGLTSGQFDLVTHIVGAIAILCEGEVIQDDCARRHTMTREEYLSIIAKKTASLISISTSAGAKAAGGSHEDVARMREFGRALGMAFQIQDDILDYTPSSSSGKSPYQDLIEGKITLPLLILLERADEEQQKTILELVKNSAESVEARTKIVEFVDQNKGVELATTVMRQYIDRALSILSEYPESKYRTALVDMCAFVSERDR
ncbi:MAG: polyprenyl synthetase family protein [Rikenellaceae bacterium]